MLTTSLSVADQCAQAKRAARLLAQIDSGTRNRALEALAKALIERTEEILTANQLDMRAGEQNGLSAALLDRLQLDPGRIEAIAAAVQQIVALPDPVGEVIEGRRLANGLELSKVRVPLGVIAVVYEARPNVTIDATALCLKSANAIVLRGSSSASHSNAALAKIAAQSVTSAGLPEGSVTLIAGGEREELAELATQTDTVDLIIPRGGEGLKAALQSLATVPVIYAASGNCHVYVDQHADPQQALTVAINAKMQRPGVCNAAETLLVHQAIAESFVPLIVSEFDRLEVAIVGDRRTRELAAHTGVPVGEALESDWASEYLAPRIAIAVLDTLEDAIEHIARYGSGHSEAILTRDTAAAHAFSLGVDAACVYVNASTRFTDGGEFGMGAEIGNSTQKLHARGPIGLRELCTFKYLVQGEGHIRA